MKTATAEKTAMIAVTFVKPDVAAPAFVARDGNRLFVKARTIIHVGTRTLDFPDETEIDIAPGLLSAETGGIDLMIVARADRLEAVPWPHAEPDGADVVGGFHFAPGGNATARAGGDAVPQINPFSIWDQEFRPACPDPRGMAFIAGARMPFWCDIYLLGVRPFEVGTSQAGETIADGADLPKREDGEEYDSLDHPTAVEIFAVFGKQLLGPEEFFEATYGVTEATGRDEDPDITGLDAPRTSKYGIMQATGNMSTWGGDGDPDGHRRACRFGGYWGRGSWAGSRQAFVGDWPDDSNEWFGARGRSDHLQLGA